MNYDSLSDKFLNALGKLRSVKPNLIHHIADILDMDETSVYRRLRGTVKFTIDEMGLLAQRFHLSLDALMGDMPEGAYQSWKMDLPLIVDENGFDLDLIEQSLPLLRRYVEEPDTERGGVIGFLSRHFFMEYREIAKFMLFKWGHYYSDIPSFSQYDTVEIPERLFQLYRDHVAEYKKIKHTFYIWDNRIISKLVDDIQYFRSMLLLSEADTLLLKKEIFLLLDDFERIAESGQIAETGNSFELYISPIHIDTSHVYLHFGNFWHYSLEVYGVRSFVTFKPHVCEDLCKRINKLKAASVLISNSAEKERILFFKKQRDIVDSL
ncbi:hypothetical protein LJC35_03105 [Parabacteroides sp. OttesenSCG-928-N08]|nr:hypothetical protein [Parabacteroides sp. OttesenSCG-928-N08]